MNPRLKNDHERLQANVVRCPEKLVRLDATDGEDPPTAYRLTLFCPGVERIDADRPVIRTEHVVEIYLADTYPFTPPFVKLLTPMFHPHVFPHNAVCLGAWTKTEYLDLLVGRLFRIFQYDPSLLDATSVANWDAQRWVERTPRGQFPLGRLMPCGQQAASQPAIRFTPAR